MRFTLNLILFFFSIPIHCSGTIVWEYDEKAFTNPTLNMRGSEFDPSYFGVMTKAIQIVQEKIKTQKGPVNILEIGGAFGRFMRFFYEHSENKNFHYTFVELCPAHVNVAQELFEKQFPHQKNVTFRSENALDFLKRIKKQYDIIFILNVLHFFNPSQLIICSQRSYDRLLQGGQVLGLGMTEFYNFEKQELSLLKVGTCPELSGEEVTRQLVELHSKVDPLSLFKGYVIYPFAHKACYCYMDESFIKDFFVRIGFKVEEASLFHISSDSFYNSNKRWIYFILNKERNATASSSIKDLWEYAVKAEKQAKALSNQYLKNFREKPAELYHQWFSYLESLGVEEAKGLGWVNGALQSTKEVTFKDS